jgi:hypothetical protein
MPQISPPSGSQAQKLYYLTVLVPMWRGQLDQLGAAIRSYRQHLLAAACLVAAKGPGGDPLQVAEFCRKWQIPLTAPAIGPVALLRKVGKAVGGWPSTAAVFDPTGAINTGTKILGAMVPLIGTIQMQGAQLVAMDTKIVPLADQTAVLSILDQARTPQNLATKIRASKDKTQAVWNDTLDFATKMDKIRTELGLPETP